MDNRFYRKIKAIRYISHGIAHIEEKIGCRRWNDTIYSGSALWTITEKFARFLIDNEEHIKKKCKYTLAADEVIWQTLIMNSDFKDQIYHFEEKDGNLYYIDWKNRDHNSPYTFGTDDVQRLVSLSGSYLYARKFDEQKDYGVIEKLMEILRE